jgi:very-short-patch-repair endonuclease
MIKERHQVTIQATQEDAASEEDPRLAKAINLFQFLAEAQALRTRPVRSVASYERDGELIWLADVPAHSAVGCPVRSAAPESGAKILTIKRVPRREPPTPPAELRSWLTSDPDDAGSEPELRDLLPVGAAVPGEVTGLIGSDGAVSLQMNPRVRAYFDDWIQLWRPWAQQERMDEPVRNLYGRLFSTHVNLTAHPEDFELIVATGCLAWRPPEGRPARRHLLTSPAAIQFDEDTGDLGVVLADASEVISVELDMLDPQLLTDPQRINAVKAEAREFAAHPLNRDAAGALARRLVHTLDPAGRYDDTGNPPEYAATPVASFAPAIVLRRRSQQGLVEVYRTIVQQLREAGEVPDGIVPLIDPDHRPRSTSDPTPGALVIVHGDPFLPLPVNDGQLEIIRSVDTKPQTVVQGPPGTGKTHTAAVLISQLLAQGKRVLVAAHTDRALKEVRDKLPAQIQPLSVAVVGGSREDLSNLHVAVDRIAAAAAGYDAQRSQRDIDEALGRIDALGRERDLVHRQLIESREQEVVEHTHRHYRGTLAAIAQQYAAEADQYGWLAKFGRLAASEPPLTNDEALEWLALARDDNLSADEAEARGRLLDLADLPAPQQFADLCERERAADEARHLHDQASQHAAFTRIRELPPRDRAQLRTRMQELAREARELEQRRESWMNDALADVRLGRREFWQSRADQIHGLIGHVTPMVKALGPLTDVRIASRDLGSIEALSQSLLGYLDAGGQIKTFADGRPKIGALTAKTVKQCAPMFDSVRVNGRPAVTAEQLRAVRTHIAALRALDALDRSWPAAVQAPEEDTLGERLAWHVTEVQQLQRLLAFGDRLAAEEQYLHAVGIAKPDWGDLDAVLGYAALVDAAAAEEEHALTSRPLHVLGEHVESAARWSDAAPCVQQLRLALLARNHDQYAPAYGRLQRLHEVRGLAARRDALGKRLRDVSPALYQAVLHSPADSDWSTRFAKLGASWDWAATGDWLRGQDTTDVNTLQAKAAMIEEQLRSQVERLAAVRAWTHAVSPGRLTGQAQADLHQYAQLVRRLGKGTGKYADRRRADIRKAMDRCRAAVPVWIMPIYRIAEQLRVAPNMFDLVVVDEASQAGLEATFLQYLAPKMVVIGDDKQVSPAAVGVDQQQLRDLANQYLAGDRYKASWEDPKRSLFDEAVMRYGRRVTLTEHRRCVPEIIGFSNRVAYELEGIRLVPVRQYGTDRLEPIKTIYTADGYERGITEKVNPVEVDAVVEQIEKCLSDQRYDGKTFGVISLLGSAQAKAIEKKLLDRTLPEEWTVRDLRCGDAADFQGSERDVVFLSMVASAEPSRRLATITQEQHLQRYNVAVSRAKDQLWLVHSLSASDVANPQDVRRQLLDYCYGVISRPATAGPATASEDVLVTPFDSLFEQRVFNRIIDRGYAAVSQFEANGYRIDIVVEGAKRRLGVVCHSDAWRGPAQYERDLARERDLERCGWQFHRIRESEFYVDQQSTLARLWDALAKAEIFPAVPPRG